MMIKSRGDLNQGNMSSEGQGTNRGTARENRGQTDWAGSQIAGTLGKPSEGMRWLRGLLQSYKSARGILEGIDRHHDTLREILIGPKAPKKAQGHKEEVWTGFEQYRCRREMGTKWRHPRWHRG